MSKGIDEDTMNNLECYVQQCRMHAQAQMQFFWSFAKFCLCLSVSFKGRVSASRSTWTNTGGCTAKSGGTSARSAPNASSATARSGCMPNCTPATGRTPATGATNASPFPPSCGDTFAFTPGSGRLRVAGGFSQYVHGRTAIDFLK